MAHEAFHEIQLNGKQLVFLFMAATVVAVVIFLMGVMVGRGVATPRTAQSAGLTAEAAIDPTAVVQPPPPPATATTTQGAPIASQETLTYPVRLESSTAPSESLKDPTPPRATATESLPKPAAEPPPDPETLVATSPLAKPVPAPVKPVPTPAKPAPTPARPAAAAPEKEVAPPAKAAAPPSKPAVPAPKPASVPATTTAIASEGLNEPAGNGFVVQVAAVKQRSEADTIARRLNGKGYPTFITMSNGAVQMYRVRVGKYPDRRQAESIAGRLEKEEQFKPWITR